MKERTYQDHSSGHLVLLKLLKINKDQHLTCKLQILLANISADDCQSYKPVLHLRRDI